MLFHWKTEISKAAVKLLPTLQYKYSSLTEKLKSLGLVGAERVDVLASNIKDVISSDGSDVSARLGGEDSDFYNSLKWAADLLRALQNGSEDTLLDLQKHRNGLASLCLIPVAPSV